jgi:hypothetical protein
MTIIYRLESNEYRCDVNPTVNSGFYQTGSSYLIDFDVKTHPMPEFVFDEGDAFGFDSMEKLIKWFGDRDELRNGDEMLRIGVYSANDTDGDDRQNVFNTKTSTFLYALCPYSMVDCPQNIIPLMGRKERETNGLKYFN